ncbi:hypothetical protein AMTR_s00051p00077950 [Amborella trichopoda]|uniref:Uncharacterized protein n=1 Tax=Amborella trichopoda TaxID=13333 RepID=U5D8D3_AMBTC|nr:hypothetical protein AMTR_s00051p00077950 [Amborella trichopoda]
MELSLTSTSNQHSRESNEEEKASGCATLMALLLGEALEDVLESSSAPTTIEASTSVMDQIPPLASVEAVSFEVPIDISEWTLVHVLTPSEDPVEFLIMASMALSEGQENVAP